MSAVWPSPSVPDDGVADVFDCGPGADVVIYFGFDPLDRLRGCERVEVRAAR